MRTDLGTIIVRANIGAFRENGGEITLDSSSVPELWVEIDLPGADPRELAVLFLRQVADSLEQGGMYAVHPKLDEE